MFSYSDIQSVIDFQSAVLSLPYGTALTYVAARYAIFAFVFLGAWLWISGNPIKRHGLTEAWWSLVIGLLITTILSHFIGRDRPFISSLDVHLLIPSPLNTSFPSGHTTVAFAIAAAFWVADRKVGTLAFVLAIMVALGRMAAGVHYPTDLLGGVVVGITSYLIVRFVHGELRRRDILPSIKAHHHDL